MRAALAGLALLALGPSAPAEEGATGWAVDREASRLGFTAWWEDRPFQGVFHRWDADIRFDPDSLEQSRFQVRVDLASADTDSADRDEALMGREWFHTGRFPRATYVTTGFTRTGESRYEAEGELTLKGNTRPVTLDLTWQETPAGARLEGGTTLRRTRFDVGTGDWTTGKTIGLDVEVSFDLRLTPGQGG